MVGAGARALIERGFEAVGRELTPGASRRALPAFHGPLRREPLRRDAALFPGVAERARPARSGGFRLAVCTNKFEQHSVELLEALGHRRTASPPICGRDTFPYFKPDPRHLTLTIDKAGRRPGAAP